MVNCIEVANELSIQNFGLLGRNGGTLKSLCNNSIVVPGTKQLAFKKLIFLFSIALSILLKRERFEMVNNEIAVVGDVMLDIY